MERTVDVVVEIPKGSRNKYEVHEHTGLVRLDRRLPGALAFPADYGYVPGARGSDDEPLDALVLTIEPTYPGVRVRVRPIGVFWISTGHGREAKLVCVPEGDPAYLEVEDLSQLPTHQLAEIANFFDIYRSLDQGSETRCDGHEGAVAAQRVLLRGGSIAQAPTPASVPTLPTRQLPDVSPRAVALVDGESGRVS